MFVISHCTLLIGLAFLSKVQEPVLSDQELEETQIQPNQEEQSTSFNSENIGK